MKKIVIFLIFTALFGGFSFSNPIMPESLISEVYFNDDDEWYLVVDVMLMDILGIQTFQEITMTSTYGVFVFQNDFLPDFNTYQTVITQEALVYQHEIYREADFIQVEWSGGFDFMQLQWGNSGYSPVLGPNPGQSLVVVFVYEDQNYNAEFWLVKNSEPWILGNGGEVTGVFDGFLFDQNMMPVANAEIKYVDEYLVNNPYSGYFPSLITNQSGYFIHDEMLACNYHLTGVVIDGIENDFDEYVSIEPGSVNTYVFNMVITGENEKTFIDEAKISNYPNPFSDVTTFFIQIPESYLIDSPVLKIINLMGQVVSEQQVTTIPGEDKLVRFVWKNLENLHSGVYSYQLITNGLPIGTGKMTIQ